MTEAALTYPATAGSASVLLDASESSKRASPLRNWTPDQLSAVRSRLSDCVHAWRDAWMAASSHEAVGVEVEAGILHGDLRSSDLDLPLCWSCSSVSNEQPAVVLARELFGAHVREGQLAHEAAVAAWKDWLRRLGGMNIHLTPQLRRSAELANASFVANPWGSALRATLPWCGVRLQVLLPGRAIASLMESMTSPAERSPSRMPSVPAGPKARLDQVLEHAPVAVRVLLADTELSVGQLQALRVGDVIPLGHALDSPARVEGLDGASICRGWLGRLDNRLAVELAAIPSIQTETLLKKEPRT